MWLSLTSLQKTEIVFVLNPPGFDLVQEGNSQKQAKLF